MFKLGWVCYLTVFGGKVTPHRLFYVNVLIKHVYLQFYCIKTQMWKVKYIYRLVRWLGIAGMSRMGSWLNNELVNTLQMWGKMQNVKGKFSFTDPLPWHTYSFFLLHSMKETLFTTLTLSTAIEHIKGESLCMNVILRIVYKTWPAVNC